jgi:hypothetical protein
MSIGDGKALIRAVARAVAVVIEQLVSELLSGLYEWTKNRRADKRDNPPR